MLAEGKIRLAAKFGELSSNIEALVTSAFSDDILLSWQDMTNLGMLDKNFNFPHASSRLIRPFQGAPPDNNLSNRQSLAITLRDKYFSDTTAENLDEKKALLINLFNDVISDSLEGKEPISGRPMKLYFKEDVKIIPFQAKTPRNIPLHMRGPADDLIKELLHTKIIAQVDTL
ncbi:Hypothetical protein FKW44_004982 [Caligus rogercresseyi]|uniref:Uncharacterized protein n=1 Tax=Caligus rogercresseyi TaxID=217165 RepID=A0A7T8HME1_CALRO|nr:Hypothetical protein FKW44_004982 [Caligus rogercresseyi]